MNPESILEQLHDIEGLDPIHWWPLAIGWWILIAIALIFFIGFTYWLISRWIFRCSWRYEALIKLHDLENSLANSTPRETLISLSEYFKRIVLQRFSRKECAGLMGDAWLKWLTEHDPKGFNWQDKGKILIEIPYSSEKEKCKVDLIQLKDLIQAVKNWVLF